MLKMLKNSKKCSYKRLSRESRSAMVYSNFLKRSQAVFFAPVSPEKVPTHWGEKVQGYPSQCVCTYVIITSHELACHLSNSSGRILRKSSTIKMTVAE